MICVLSLVNKAFTFYLGFDLWLIFIVFFDHLRWLGVQPQVGLAQHMIDPLLGLSELLLDLGAHNLLYSVFLHHFKSSLVHFVDFLASELLLFPILLLFRPGIIHDLRVRFRLN